MSLQSFQLKRAISKHSLIRNYHGSIDAHIRGIYHSIIGIQKSENGDPLLDRPTSLKDWILDFTCKPLIEQYSVYNWDCFWSDLSASMTNACLLIPGGLAYSGLARLSSIHGLISAIIPVLIYPLFGNSRQLSVGKIFFVFIELIESDRT